MSNSRDDVILKTSIISIIVNILLVIFKAFVGFLANSIAILSDAVNNLSDALSSIITIIGMKLSTKSPDKKHPYGYGRIEYMASFVISFIVLYAGINVLVESIKKIIHPEDTNYNIFALIILFVGVVVKFILGIYAKKKGKSVLSDSLVASGEDAFNDALLSISVLVSSIIYMVFKIKLENYIGIFLSVIIIKSGLEIIKDATNNILETRIDKDLSNKIKEAILEEKGIEGVFDLILNNHGPLKYWGTCHVSVSDRMSVAELDKISRQITKNVFKKTGILIHTIGVYSINTDNKNILKIQNEIAEIVFSNKEVVGVHGFYLDEVNKIINFDIAFDFDVNNYKAILDNIQKILYEKYKGYKINISIDFDVSD